MQTSSDLINHSLNNAFVEATACIQVDDLQFAIRRSSKRRTMQITVERTGQLVLAAPREVGLDQLRKFIDEKRFGSTRNWRKKSDFSARFPRRNLSQGRDFCTWGALID